MASSAGTRQLTPQMVPALTEPFHALLHRTGVELDDEQVRRLTGYRDLLHTANQTTNLTAVRDLAGIERRLVVESLRLVEPIRALPDRGRDRTSLLDLGTGGGLPGLVLAIALPWTSVFLLDATGKKVAFLDRTVGELGLTNVTTIHARAEETAHLPRYRNAFDVVTARAVSSLPALLELGLPFLKMDGRLMLPKGIDIDDELTAGRQAATVLGGTIESWDVLPESDSTIDTRLVIVRKTTSTPGKYPRRAGLPSRAPLGGETSVQGAGYPKGGGP